MKFRRFLTAGAAVAIAIGIAVVAAPSASAGQPIIWHQAVAVASSSSPCPATAAEETQAGWSEWTNSWAEWPHDGKGGNVCTRSITWAYEADALLPASCINTYGGYYANFNGDWFIIPVATAYSDSGCLSPVGSLGYGYVFAPGGADQGTERCLLKFGVGVTLLGETGDRVYQCDYLV